MALFLGYTPAVARDENVWFAPRWMRPLACLACFHALRRDVRNSTCQQRTYLRLVYRRYAAAEAAGLLAGHLGMVADDTHITV